MNKDKQKFYSELFALTFLISIAIISVNLDLGVYVTNSRAIEFVNQDVTYLKDMQMALTTIPSLEKIILTQECNSILISSVQGTFSIYGILTLVLLILLLVIYRKRFSKFDDRITEFRLILKQGKKVYSPLFFAFFTISIMFLALAFGLELSKNQTTTQMLSDMTGTEIGQEDKLLLLETLLFDTSQSHFQYLFYGSYFLGIGISSLFAYLVHIFKKGPNLLSSAIIYGTIIAIIYFPILLMNLPEQGYSSLISSGQVELFCNELVNPDQQNEIVIENSNSILNHTSNHNSTQDSLEKSVEE